jgi:hypothetical protein
MKDTADMTIAKKLEAQSNRIDELETINAKTLWAADETERALQERIAELEAAILKNCDITVKPWRDLIDPSKALAGEAK